MSGRTDECWIRIGLPEGDAGMTAAIEIAHGHGGILVAAWDYTDPEGAYGWIVIPMEQDRGISATMACIEAGLIPRTEAIEAQLHAAPPEVH